ncbi:MAG: hypothetical protein KDA58_02060, partial [Planctomycetaceae bacterium]|nr:hypothetical protein [Planctomycetaceae bacterium]
DIRFVQLPVSAAKGTLPERINVALDWPGGQGLKFSNSQWGRDWLVRTPSGGRFLRTNVHFAKGWGLGQHLLLQLGTEVFGVSPLSLEGERRARILWPGKGWHVDSLGDRFEAMLSFYEDKPASWIGFPSPPSRMIDEFEHYVGAVGPVTTDYFCVQQKGSLVAVDPATGRELWRRPELPRLAECVGDTRQLLVWGARESQGTLIRAVDGVELGRRTIPHSLRQRRIVRDGCALFGIGSGFHDELSALVGEPDAEAAAPDVEAAPKKEGAAQPEIDPSAEATTAATRSPDAVGDASVAETTDAVPGVASSSKAAIFEWWNLLSGEQIWRQVRQAGTIPFEVDHELCGLLQTDGQLELLDLATGETVLRHQLMLSAPCTRIGCAVGERTLLVAVSLPVQDLALRNAPQLHGGYRSMFLNGFLLCFDRRDRTLLWQQTVENAVFPLDQPADLPLFILTGSRLAENAMNSNTVGSSRFDIYDRRDGTLVFSDEAAGPKWNFYAVTGDAESRQIRIKTQAVLFELDYSDPEASTAGDVAQ